MRRLSIFRLLRLLKFSWAAQVAAPPSTPAGERWMSDNIKSRSLTSKNYSPMREGCREFVCPLCKPLNPPHPFTSESQAAAAERVSVKQVEKFNDGIGLGLLRIPQSIIQEQSFIRI